LHKHGLSKRFSSDSWLYKEYRQNVSFRTDVSQRRHATAPIFRTLGRQSSSRRKSRSHAHSSTSRRTSSLQRYADAYPEWVPSTPSYIYTSAARARTTLFVSGKTRSARTRSSSVLLNKHEACARKGGGQSWQSGIDGQSTLPMGALYYPQSLASERASGV